MKFGVSDVCLEHDPGERHPENPDRIRAIKRGLKKRHGVEYVEGDPADEDDARAVHDDDYVAEIREFCEDGGGSWDPDTVAVEATWRAALASAGLSMWAADAALDGQDGRATPFALGRPPGHHAVEDDAMGFCFVNNAAVASQYALDALEAERVAVFDWDVHHGNGTQDIFYDRGDVFYASVHEDGLYPGTGEIDEVGEGDGEGATLNAPLPAGAGDVDYCYVFDETIAPAIQAFDPDLLLVSAGFDAHRHDPISRMHVSTDGYGTLTARVRDLAERCDAGLGFVLEGGYSLDTLSEGVGMVHEVFDGLEPTGPDTDAELDEDVREVVAELRDVHGLGSK
ncbi:histone deacetylase family protein [Halarchaeum sp. P4]|uniref:histone deacetylase family protein n=1 Tax=Halarchaeum sp. P4 TaxID=3421639 RepID=UPI003EBB81DA